MDIARQPWESHSGGRRFDPVHLHDFLTVFSDTGLRGNEILRIITAAGDGGPIVSRSVSASAGEHGEHPPLVSAGDRLARDVAFARRGLRLVTEGLSHGVGGSAPLHRECAVKATHP